MGLFLKEDGTIQGWLAALLCCWAAVNEDELPDEKRRISRPAIARNTIWNEQPTPLQPLSDLSTHSASSFSTRDICNTKDVDMAFDEHDRVRPVSERPHSLKRLSSGAPSLLDRVHLHPRRKSSTSLQMRISIGRPTEVRRLDLTDKQRLSLKPLQLSPVVLRDATPEADIFDRPMNRSAAYNDDLDDPSNGRSYRASRGTPFQRCQHASSLPSASVAESGQVITDPNRPPTSSSGKPSLLTRTSSSSLRSLRRQAVDTNPSGMATPRPSSERIRLKRKRSAPKTLSDSTDDDVDREILELNTIVEERRAESTRPPSRSEGHVAAVAPLMSLRARSQTLTDIGSAFSRPLISTSIPSPALDAEPESPIQSPIKSRLSRPFIQLPDAAAFEQAAQEERPRRSRRSSSRVAGWLSNLLGSAHNSTSSFASEASLCTADGESPVASSPVSKGGHSRSLTAESRTTPPSTVHGETESAKEVERWPVLVRNPRQVGVAM